MSKSFLPPMLCCVAALLAPASADITTVSPWHTAGNGNPTDFGGGWSLVPNVGIYHQAKSAFGAGPLTGQMVVYALGFSDLQGISYTGQPVANVSIQPVSGWTGGVSFYGFDLGVWQTPPLERPVHYEVWNGDCSSLLTSGTVTVGAIHQTVNMALFSPNGFNLQFESAGVVAIDNYRVEGSDSAAPKPSIVIKSSTGVEIANGDATPAGSDETDFGTPAQSGGTVTRTFTLANVGNEALNLTGAAPNFVTLSGSGDFTVTAQPVTPLAALTGTTTFSIAFTPSSSGVKTATVSVPNNDATKNPYTFSISGYSAGFSNGVPDVGFGSSGIVRSDSGSNYNEYGRAVAVQADGKIVVAGYAQVGGNPQFALARYTASGQPDPTFGSGGMVLTDVSPTGEEARAVAVQTDQKILVAGYSLNGANVDFVLLRYTTAGVLDTTFGTAGKVVSPIGSSDDFANAMVVQSNGRIILAGYAFNGSNYDVAVARYTDTGVLDTSFGTGGKVITPVGSNNDIASSVALQSDGKIVVGGSVFSGSSYDIAVLRYTTTGALDTTFGGTGKVVTSLVVGNDLAQAVGVQQDGKIVVAGYALNGGNNDFAVARYTASGVLDSGFGTGGFTLTPVGSNQDYGRGLVLQGDGKIIVAGSAEVSGNNDFAVVRYTTSGALDTTFGIGGKVTTALSPTNDQGQAVALQPDGRIVVAGEAFGTPTNSDFAVIVYGVPKPDIAVAQSSALIDGTGSVAIGAVPVGVSSAPITFTITNPGLDDLSSLTVVKSGADSGDFTVSGLSSTSILVGAGTATFTVTFSPTISGVKSADLQIFSNVTGNKDPFDISITGRALSFDDDSDSDGLSDAAEFQMAAFGFDWQSDQSALVATYFAAAGSSGLYTPAQLQSLNGTTPLIQRNQSTGLFTLTLGVEKSTTLSPGSFLHFPMTAPQIGTSNGKVLFTFPGPDPKAFYRLKIE